MKKILIADAGGTGVNWCIASGDKRHSFDSPGINPVTMTPEEVDCSLRDALAGVEANEIYYYGAGCRGKFAELVKDSLSRLFPDAAIEVESDMVGAARALFGSKPGIACILGTGSNSCLYDGVEIVDQVPSLGFILGDEGSGAYLGKILAARVFKRALPEQLADRFYKEYNLDVDSLIEHVYRQPAPNRYLASFTRFLSVNIAHPDIEKLVLEAFDSFIERNVMRYPGFRTYKVGFVGSIADVFRQQLVESFESHSLDSPPIIRHPLQRITDFHINTTHS